MLTHLETVGAADRGEVGVRMATEVELAAYISLIEVYSFHLCCCVFTFKIRWRKVEVSTNLHPRSFTFPGTGLVLPP